MGRCQKGSTMFPTGINYTQRTKGFQQEPNLHGNSYTQQFNQFNFVLAERPYVRAGGFALGECVAVSLLTVSRISFKTSFFGFGCLRAGGLFVPATVLVLVSVVCLRDLDGGAEAFSVLGFAVWAVFLTRTVVLAFVRLALIVGNLTVAPRFEFVDAFFGEAFVDILAPFADFFRDTVALVAVARALETAFLTPDLMDDGAKGPRFFVVRERDLLRAFSFLRFAAFAFFASAISFILAAFNSSRCSFSLFRGPRKPRHCEEPHRHC